MQDFEFILIMASFGTVAPQKIHVSIKARAATYSTRSIHRFTKRNEKKGSDCTVADDAQAVVEAARANTGMGKSVKLNANLPWELGEYFESENNHSDHALTIEFVAKAIKDGQHVHELLQRRQGKNSRKATNFSI